MRVGLAIVLGMAVLLAGCAADGPATSSSHSKTSKKTSSHGVTTSVSDGSSTSEQPTSSDSGSSEPSTSSASSSSSGSPPPADPGQPPPPHVWPSLDSASIRPGVQTYTDGGQCTANFVFLSADNQTVYIGQAAHCASLGGSTDTDGCQTGSRELGTAVEVDGMDGHAYHGKLVYSSWLTMHAVHENGGEVCQYNDFALVELDENAAAEAHPAMQKYGGPIGIADPTAIGFGDKVLTYGNSGLRFGLSPLSPKEGWVIFTPGNGWTTSIYTVTPGVPGDSGSGVLDAKGAAVGDLVTLGIDGSNGVTILAKALAYANTVGGMDVHLATWDQLDPGLFPPL